VGRNIQTVGGSGWEGLVAEELHRRNQELAAALVRARRRMRRSLDDVAAHLGTTRKRYTRIESGATPISAAELEVLVRYLEIPYAEVWPLDEILADTRQVIVDARPGQAVHVLVRVAAERISEQQGLEQSKDS
jgi:transcriptional regulator with XRE-family HTH domain